jgi:hypothetical protein
MLIVPALLSGCDEQDAASDPAPRHAGVRLSNLLGEVGDAGFARADRVRVPTTRRLGFHRRAPRRNDRATCIHTNRCQR